MMDIKAVFIVLINVRVYSSMVSIDYSYPGISLIDSTDHLNNVAWNPALSGTTIHMFLRYMLMSATMDQRLGEKVQEHSMTFIV